MCFYCDRRFRSARELDRHMLTPCRLSPAIARYRSLATTGVDAAMSKSKGKTTNNNGMPVPTEGPAGDLPAFIRAADLGKKEGAKGVITFLGKPARKIESQYGEQYAFPIKFKGTVYDWPIRIDSGNHRRIFDRFGNRPPKGTVNVELKTYNRNLYIAIK